MIPWKDCDGCSLAGQYKFVWTDYKTSKSLGIQARLICRPTTKRLLDVYLQLRVRSDIANYKQQWVKLKRVWGKKE